MTTEAAASYYIRTHFRSRFARPVVTHFYSPKSGWLPALRREHLTPAVATAYLDRGFVMVKARARFRTVEVILSNYLGRKNAASANR